MKYVKVKKGESQYGSEPDIHMARAVYIHAGIKEDDANPFIASLPKPLYGNDIKIAYSKDLLSYDPDKVRMMSDYERMDQISMLRSIRFPLPFHDDLERWVYDALRTSYRMRDLTPVTGKKVTYVDEGGETKTSDCKLNGSPKKPTNEGVSLVGLSGCGKSSAVDILLSRYPQVLIHEDEENGRFVNVVWLVVSCMPNSNFSAMYQGFGAALDKALNYSEPVYEKELSQNLSVAKLTIKVKQLIEKFCIGLIVFDEVQLINFGGVKENSFESLLNLANDTKVVLLVVGTEDAEAKMFGVQRTARRIGPPLHADGYCRDRKYFGLLVRKLFEYQWFDEFVSVTPDITEAFYDVTKGVVAHLVSIYSTLTYDYLSKTKRPVINGDYIRQIAKTYYPGLERLLDEVDEKDRVAALMADGEMNVKALIEKARQKDCMEQEIADSDADSARRILKRDVYQTICPMYPEYDGYMFENAFNAVMRLKSAEGKSDGEIARMVLERLQKEPKKRVKKGTRGPALDRSQMLGLLGMEGDDAE